MNLLLLVLAGCPLRIGPAPLTPEPPTAEAAVSFAPLEARLDALLGDVEDADRRDRLVALRELVLKMRGQPAPAQERVYAYVDRVLGIEERERPITIDGGLEPIGPVIEEETPAPPPPDRAEVITRARTALAAGRYLDAIEILAPLTDGEAGMLRQEAVDGWARAERERAGQIFLAARALPVGPDRTAQLRAARDALAAVNERFPANAYAPQIAENVAVIDGELAR